MNMCSDWWGRVDSLAVPHAEHAVVFSTLEQIGLLAAPDSGCRQVLVDTGLEMDVVTIQPGARLPHGLIDAAEGGAAVAGNEARGVQPALAVSLMLQNGKAHQRLDARHISAGLVQGVLVVEAHRLQCLAHVSTHVGFSR
jgi:hypothetical protein